MTLVTLELQLGATEPDDRGGTQTGVILWRITVCAFQSSAYGRFLLEEDHIILLSASVLSVTLCDMCVDYGFVILFWVLHSCYARYIYIGFLSVMCQWGSQERF